MRLQKYIAQSGITSRRKAEELITLGRVKVNDIIVNELGAKIDPINDKIFVDNKKVILENNKVYLMLYKPTGYITTASDQFNRKTVLDLIDEVEERIYPIGRLDYDTSGLLLLTNDGDLTFKLTHPKHEIKKTYIALVRGIPNEKELRSFRNGIDIGDYITSNADIRIIKANNNSSVLEIIIHEGKNRQIRRMCEKINHPVIELKRIAIGNIKLGKLNEGNWRHLIHKEVEYLKGL